MSFFKLTCHNRVVKEIELWILSDIKGFTARKLICGKCEVCGEDVVTLIETRIKDGKIFVNKNIKGIEAVKTLYREKKRLIVKQSDVDITTFSNWVWGLNVEIKNKKGETVQIRQYACELKTGRKKLQKTIYFQ